MKSCSLEVGLITNLFGKHVACIGLGNTYIWPLGYIIVWVSRRSPGLQQGPNSPGSPRFINFAAQVPIILGTPTISHIVNVMKERETDALAMPWVNAWMAHLLSVQSATARVEDSQAMGESSLSGYNEVVIIKKAETIDAFPSHVTPMKTEKAYLRGRINVMTQALQVEDRSLPQGLTMQNAYMDLRTGSKNATVVVRNSTAYPKTLKKKTLVAQAVVATAISELLAMTQLLEGEEEPHTPQSPRLTVRQRQGKLLEELDLSGLASWPPELADSAWLLLVEYHDVFSLEPGKLGCTHPTKHVIKVMEDTPFKEWIWWIPLPLVEEVHSHMWDAGFGCHMIQPECMV